MSSTAKHVRYSIVVIGSMLLYGIPVYDEEVVRKACNEKWIHPDRPSEPGMS